MALRTLALGQGSKWKKCRTNATAPWWDYNTRHKQESKDDFKNLGPCSSWSPRPPPPPRGCCPHQQGEQHCCNYQTWKWFFKWPLLIMFLPWTRNTSTLWCLEEAATLWCENLCLRPASDLWGFANKYIWWSSCWLMSCLSLDVLRFSLISKYVWSNYLQFPFLFIDLQMWLSGGKLFSLAYYMSGQTICNIQFTSSLWTEKFLAERGHFDPWACLGLAAKIQRWDFVIRMSWNFCKFRD